MWTGLPASEKPRSVTAPRGWTMLKTPVGKLSGRARPPAIGDRAVEAPDLAGERARPRPCTGPGLHSPTAVGLPRKPGGRSTVRSRSRARLFALGRAWTAAGLGIELKSTGTVRRLSGCAPACAFEGGAVGREEVGHKAGFDDAEAARGGADRVGSASAAAFSAPPPSSVAVAVALRRGRRGRHVDFEDQVGEGVAGDRAWWSAFDRGRAGCAECSSSRAGGDDEFVRRRHLGADQGRRAGRL